MADKYKGWEAALASFKPEKELPPIKKSFCLWDFLDFFHDTLHKTEDHMMAENILVFLNHYARKRAAKGMPVGRNVIVEMCDYIGLRTEDHIYEAVSQPEFQRKLYRLVIKLGERGTLSADHDAV